MPCSLQETSRSQSPQLLRESLLLELEFSTHVIFSWLLFCCCTLHILDMEWQSQIWLSKMSRWRALSWHIVLGLHLVLLSDNDPDGQMNHRMSQDNLIESTCLKNLNKIGSNCRFLKTGSSHFWLKIIFKIQYSTYFTNCRCSTCKNLYKSYSGILYQATGVSWRSGITLIQGNFT